MEVAQGYDEEEAGGVAHLRGRDDQRCQGRAAVEVVRHQVEQGLGVVEVGYHGPGRDGDQGHQGAGQLLRLLRGGRCGRHPFRLTAADRPVDPR